MREKTLAVHVLTLGLALAMGACGDDEPTTAIEPEIIALSLTASFAPGTMAEQLVVDATGEDLDEPVRATLAIDDYGRAKGQMMVPEGVRTFTAVALDAAGAETHEGSVTDDIRAGLVNIARIPLQPIRMEELAADWVVASFEVVVEPAMAQVTAGEAVQLSAAIVDHDGDPVPGAEASWTSGDPTLAPVDGDGRVETAALPGLEGTTRTVRIAASYEGVFDVAELTVVHPEDGSDPFGLKRLAEIISSDDPPLREQINEHLTVVLLGQGSLVDGAPDMPLVQGRIPNSTADPGELPVDQATYGEQALVAVNTRTLNEFEIRMAQALLDEVHALRAEHGLTSASEGVDDGLAREGYDPAAGGRSAGAVGPLGWSDGVDTRIVRSPTTQWPWRAIAQFTYGGGTDSRCTGTLIGPRHVITAAHCINKFGTSNWFTATVSPARNGESSLPFGSSTIKVDPDPGTEAWYFTPAPWRDSTTTDRWQWDWGMIVIPDRLGDQTGWMGYVARPFGALDGVANLNRGYPSCRSDYSERPAGCEKARLYGDTELCDLGDVYFPGGDGWNRMISFGCDISRGHSGSAIYHYFYDAQLGKTVPVVSMVVSFHQCLTCGEGSGYPSYPNFARRITPGGLAVISSLRQTFP